MNKDDVIRKIKKCLALGRSGEANEAKRAMQQAQALMQQYGIDHPEILASDVRTEQVRRVGGNHIPVRYESLLTANVSKAFGCKFFLSREWNNNSFTISTNWNLVGCAPGVDVGAYMLDILLRQLRKARGQYIKKALKRCGKKNKTARADVFCEGWVIAASEMVASSEPTVEQTKSIDAYMRQHHADLTSFTPKCHQAKGVDTYVDYFGGQIAGKRAELHSGIGTRAAPRLIEA